MKEIDLVSLIGKPSDSLEVKDLLSRLKLKAPKLKKGDVRTTVEAKSAGFFLTFTDEAFLTKNENLSLGEGGLVLTGVSFLKANPPEWAGYTGDLPLQVRFEDSQRAVRARLGDPEWKNETLGTERWLKDGKRVFAQYDDELAHVTEFGVSLPD